MVQRSGQDAVQGSRRVWYRAVGRYRAVYEVGYKETQGGTACSLQEAASSESISLEQGQNNGKHSPPEAGNAESKAMARRQIRKVDAEQTS